MGADTLVVVVVVVGSVRFSDKNQGAVRFSDKFGKNIQIIN